MTNIRSPKPPTEGSNPSAPAKRCKFEHFFEKKIVMVVQRFAKEKAYYQISGNRLFLFLVKLFFLPFLIIIKRIGSAHLWTPILSIPFPK
jgi:hypothetical protein